MSDEPTFDFKPWEDLSVGVRRNRKKMYEYMVSVLNGDEPGPTPPGPTPTGTGTVTATVLDGTDNDEPVKDAMVYLVTQAPPQSASDLLYGYVTDANGECTLHTLDNEGEFTETVADIEYGTYTIFAMNQGMTLSYTGSLTVDGDENVTITLTAAATTGTVTVTCQDSNGDPITNGFVGLFEELGTPPVASGDIDSSTGVVIMEDVPFGTYILIAENESETLLYMNNEFVVDGDEEVTITLTEA